MERNRHPEHTAYYYNDINKTVKLIITNKDHENAQRYSIKKYMYAVRQLPLFTENNIGYRISVVISFISSYSSLSSPNTILITSETTKMHLISPKTSIRHYFS